MKTVEEFFKANDFVEACDIDRQDLISKFLSEMEKGLAGEESSLRMIPTYVGVDGKIPQGAKAAVLDAGGTNFRSAIVSIPPVIEDKVNQPMPGTCGEVDEDSFYKAFADELNRVKDKATVSKFGFCFSYNCDATEDLDAKLNVWTKGIQAPSIVGQYIGKELLKRLGGGSIAIINDTVATLLAAKAMEGDKTYSSYLGFILGTGTNTAYVERNNNITKLQGLDAGGSMIINSESGGFDKIKRSAFDISMDARQPDPGHNPFEKMIAGGYLGGVGLELFKAAAKEGFFSRQATDAINGLGCLETIDFDTFTAGMVKEGRVNPLDTIFEDPADAKMARRLALPVFERAAVLTAIHLAAFVIKSGGGIDSARPVAINADGSTYYKTRAVEFDKLVRAELDEMLVKRRNIHYAIVPQVDDAPMVGAAIAAML
ncbi:MAG: hexokinase [Kiritimatiellae bacterium]|nr:hexokinase [Kiritimatiellia bacterium]